LLWAIQVSFTLFHTFRLGAQRTFEPGEDIVISGKRMIRERNIARMFAALSATNEAVLRTTSQEELYQRVCDAAVHEGAFKGAIHADQRILAQSGRGVVLDLAGAVT